MKKFTFKNQPKETGLASVGNPNPQTDVKFEKKLCGLISPPNWQSKGRLYTIMLSIKNVDSSTGWSWITFKKRTETLQEAKEWLNTNCDAILIKYELHFPEEE